MTANSPMKPYIKAAHWFPLGINLFADPRSVLLDGMADEFLERTDAQ